MGPVEPPQQKGRLPQYAHDKLVELQEKFDHLEQLAAFQRPEDGGITVEYVNPSFLAKTPSGGTRLVTAFADVGRYSKPQPSLLPDVDSTLGRIVQWSLIVVRDLTSAFYQIPLAKESIRHRYKLRKLYFKSKDPSVGIGRNTDFSVILLHH